MLKDGYVRKAFQEYWTYTEGKHGFKVFVVTTRGGGWAYYARPTYEEALSSAMRACESDNALRCRLFAVGDTIVWDMSKAEVKEVVENYRAEKSSGAGNPYPNLLKGPQIIGAFTDYQADDDSRTFKVFAKDKQGAYQYAVGHETYEAAVKAAMDGCKKWSVVRNDSTERCRLFAVGNTVVWDMSEEEGQKRIALYRNRTNKSTANTVIEE